MTLYCSKCGKNIGARLHDSTGQETCASCDDRAVAARTVRESTTTGNSCLGTALGVLAATVGLVALLCMAGCGVDPAQAPYHHAAQTCEARAAETPACAEGQIVVLGMSCMEPCPPYRVDGVGTISWWKPTAQGAANAEARKRLAWSVSGCTKWRRDDCLLCWVEGSDQWAAGYYTHLESGEWAEYDVDLSSPDAVRQAVKWADPPSVEEWNATH
jgi:hypothetical protein